MTDPRPVGPVVFGRVLNRHRWALVRLALWSAGQALPGAASGLLIARAVDRFLAGESPTGLVLLGLLALLSVAGAVATRRVYPPLTDVVEAVHDEFLTGAVRGAVRAAAWSAGRPDTSPVAAITVRIQSLRGIVSVLLRSVQYLVVALTGAVCALVWLAPIAALVTGGLVVLSFGLFACCLPVAARRHRELMLAEEELSRRAGAVLSAARDIIAMGREERAVAELTEVIEAEAARAVRLARTEVVRPALAFLGAQVPLILLLVGAPWLVAADWLTVGAVVGTATYLVATLDPALRGLFAVLGGWGLELAVLLGRLGEGLGPTDEPAQPSRLPAPESVELTVTGLAFGYSPHARPVLEDLTLTVPEGDHLAVVGPSGIGKSTLAALLAGLLEPGTGRIELGGIELHQVRRAELRRMVGFLPQEAYVLAGTLRENLCYLRPNADDRMIYRAAGAVGLTGLLDRLGGLDTRVGAGGAELSGGEAQLVALTRVYLSEARLVILDEATSLLDPGAEGRAEAAFAARPASTLIVIAHRVSSARRARRVLVLDGERHQLGEHRTLLDTSPLYASISGHWTVESRSA